VARKQQEGAWEIGKTEGRRPDPMPRCRNLLWLKVELARSFRVAGRVAIFQLIKISENSGFRLVC
jgi:hypothetical protein